MSLKSIIKEPVKQLFANFPFLDVLARRFLWKRFYPRLYYHEPEMVYFDRLPRGAFDIVFDVGAAMGSFCWILQSKSQQIYAFEPGRVHYNALSRAALGTNVQVIRAAVGSVVGEVELITPSSDANDRYCASVSKDNPVIQQSTALVDVVEQLTLDHFADEHVSAGRSVDFIKIDIEGYELEALRGGITTISTHLPLILIEIEARHNANYIAAFEFLFDLGYLAYTFDGKIFIPHDGRAIEQRQRPEDLEKRLHGGTKDHSAYVNNFIFRHPDAKVGIPT